MSKYYQIQEAPPAVLAAIMILFMLFLIFYNLVFEQVWKGQTPGKRIMRLRAVNDDGTFMTFSAVALRNLFRIVDMLPLGYIAGLVTMSLNSRRKRIGDYVAGTIVIRERGEAVPDFGDGGEDPFAAVPGLEEAVSPSLKNIVASYVRSRSSMERRARERVEREIASLVEERTGVPRPEGMERGAYLASLYRRLS